MKTCGNCLYGRHPDGQFIECWGAPPSPYVLAVGQDQLGRPQMRVELIRPRLAKTTAHCGAWQDRKAATEIVGSITPPLEIDLSTFKKNAGKA